MNIYQLLDLARSCTPTSMAYSRATDSFGQVMQSVPFCCFFSRNTVWRVYENTPNITVTPDHRQAGWKTSFSVSYGWNCKLEALSAAHLPVTQVLSSLTHIYIRYTGLILYQCNAHPVFLQVTYVRMFIRFFLFLHESSHMWAHSEVLYVLVVVYGLSI